MMFPLFGYWQPIGMQWDVIAAACVVLCIPLAIVAGLLVRHHRVRGGYGRLWGLAPVAALPYAWYAIVANHSWVHY